MMNWTKIQNALVMCFSHGTGGLCFIWENEPREMLQKPFGVLRLGQSAMLGRDQMAYTFRDSDMCATIFGTRELTVTCQVWSRSQLPTENARFYLEIARSSLAKPTQKKLLKSAGLVFVQTHPITNIDVAFDSRQESRSAFDVVFRITDFEENVDAGCGYFNHVQILERVASA